VAGIGLTLVFLPNLRIPGAAYKTYKYGWVKLEPHGQVHRGQGWV
jgi:hypothetical protein